MTQIALCLVVPEMTRGGFPAGFYSQAFWHFLSRGPASWKRTRKGSKSLAGWWWVDLGQCQLPDAEA